MTEAILELIPRIVECQKKIILQHQNLFTEQNAEEVGYLITNNFVTSLVNKLNFFESILANQTELVGYKDKIKYIKSLFGPEEVLPDIPSTYSDVSVTISNVPNTAITFE